MTQAHRYTSIPDWFQWEAVGDEIFRVTETYYREDYRCNIYVIAGSQFSLVLDSGLGLAPLRPLVESLVSKPVLVNSHGHYDHIGGSFEFAERWIHPAEAHILAAPTHENTHANLLLATEDFRQLPWAGFRAEEWMAESALATRLIVEGDILEQGERCWDVLHTPGHSWGSICLWDKSSQALFCADTVYAGELFDHLPCSDIPTYAQSLRRLREYPVRVAYPGHGPVLSGDSFRAIIDHYLQDHGL